MGNNKKSAEIDENDGFKRIKEQRKKIKNFKNHLKDLAREVIDNEDFDEDSFYNR